MNAVPESSGGQSNLPLLALLGDRSSDKVRKALSAYIAVGMGAKAVHSWYKRTAHDLRFSVAVPDDDDVYPALHQWTVDQLPPGKRRSILVRSSRRRGDVEMIASSAPPQRPKAPELKLYLRSERAQTLVLDGHRIKVKLEEHGGGGESDSDRMRFRKPDEILFEAQTAAGRDAVLDLIERLASQQRAEPEIRVFVAQRWGDWERRQEMVTRSLDTVVLKAGQKEELVADLQEFLNREADYLRLGLPWHRGLLLSGPPGTGKTSIARALASHLHLDLYYIPLSALPNDSTLISLLGRVSPRSMLLLEDIDIVHGAKVRDDGEPGVTLSGLLNGLDGLLTPHGLVTVLTTNELDVIDPALTRPGRIDRQVEIGYLDSRQLAELARVIVGRPVDLRLPHHRCTLSPADVVEVCKRHLGSPEDTILALKALVA